MLDLGIAGIIGRMPKLWRDGVAARLVDFSQDAHGIAVELQPMRWALRLVAGDAAHSVAALCVTRSADGRWLAGRRAAWNFVLSREGFADPCPAPEYIYWPDRSGRSTG